jgi:hypothetical protein
MYWAYSLGGREKECTHNFNVETLGEISISLVTRLVSGEPRLVSQLHQGIFLFATTFRLALDPTQPPIQWVPGTLSLEVKQLEHEAVLPLSHTSSWYGA